jgi:F0F1-type ATP synthase membrane subunit b/b'
MIFAIATFIANQFGIDFAKARLYAIVALCSLGLLIFASLAFWVDSCRQNRLEKKIDRIESNITEAETISNVLTNQKENIKQEVDTIEVNKNAAKENINASIKRDSSTYDYREAEDKFCRRYPCDTSCQSWRERTGKGCE